MKNASQSDEKLLYSKVQMSQICVCTVQKQFHGYIKRGPSRMMYQGEHLSGSFFVLSVIDIILETKELEKFHGQEGKVFVKALAVTIKKLP